MRETRETKQRVHPQAELVKRPRRTPLEIEKARKVAAKNEKGCLFWLPSRVEGPDSEPRLSDDPFEGNVAVQEFSRILRKGRTFKVKGQVRLGEEEGDRDIMAKLIIKPGRMRHDQEEIIAKKFFSEADFETMGEGVYPKGTKPPQMHLANIDHLTEKEADDYCTLHKVLVPAGADLLVKRQYIKKALSTTR